MEFTEEEKAAFGWPFLCAPCMHTYLQGESPCRNLMEVKCSEAQGLNR